MELTDAQVDAMTPDEFLAHHGFNLDDILGDGMSVQWHLEHYGVKGMHWGIRNESDKPDSERVFKTYRRSKPAIAAVGVGAAVATGLVVGATLPVSAPAIAVSAALGGFIAQDIFIASGKLKIKEITR